jgi:DNA-binding NarL/FixJ family response regulator
VLRDPALVGLRCVIIDDSPEVVDALRRSLEADGVIVLGTASTGAEGVHRTGQLGPDCVLLDVDLGDESGLDVARELAAAGSSAAVILISAHAEYAELADDTPVAGFLSKSGLSRAAIEQILAGPGRGSELA